MSRTVTISVEASAPDTDAPTVDDLLAQLRDYFDLLNIVEENLAADGQTAVQWRVISAAKASPLSFTCQAFPRQFAVNIDTRVDMVLGFANTALMDLCTGNDLSAVLLDGAAAKALSIFQRVTNGLGRTVFETDSPKIPVVALTPPVARVAVRTISSQLSPVDRPYKELGSIEGYVETVSLDGWGRRILYLKHRISGAEVKCVVSGDAEREFALREIADVWRKQRVTVSGTIHFKSAGRISHVDVDRVRFLRSRTELPGVDDIIDVGFTGGMKSEEYLAKLRDGEST